MPPVIMVFIVATLAASIAAVVGGRNGAPIAQWCALLPSEVMRGQLWRLFTWVFFELEHPINLVFACLSFYWFGSDLAYRWGAARFVVYTLGIASLVGAAVCGLSLVLPSATLGGYATAWPLQDAIIILWATYFPTRQINLYMVLPLNGRALITVTVVGTVLYALYAGFAVMLPHFVAEGIALAALRLPSPRMWWLERKLRGMEKQRRSSHLKAVPRDADASSDDKSDPPGGRWLN
jgi:membrane associated rhomboid family serine protease